MNVTPVWEDYSGEGIVVGIVDDGVLYTHPDLSANYRTDLDLDARGGDLDAIAEADDGHGTWVASMVAADDDGSGMVGVAPDAQITGFRMGYGSDGSLAQEQTVLEQMVNVDVANNSWGYNGYFWDNFESSYFNAHGQAVEDAATLGRDGLGTVTVFAAGNAGDEGQNTNYHSYLNSPYAITVGALDSHGDVTYFSTPGASVLVSAPGQDVALVNDDPNLFSIVSGTSFAAPAVSGVVALMLEANPDLGYRDVQEILAYSSWESGTTTYQTNGADNWNGGGLTVNDGAGFGMVDAHAAVRLAETWTAQSTVSNMQTLSMSSAPGAAFTLGSGVTDTITFAQGLELDHVQVRLDIDHTWIGDLSVSLTSPDGTTSLLVDQPGYGSASQDDVLFTFGSVQYWGEDGIGDWTLSVNDLAAGDDGILQSWEIILHGDVIDNDDTYFFTDEWAGFGADGARSLLTDTLGTDTLNFATITSDLTIDMAAGSVNSLLGQSFQIDGGSVFENVFGGDGNDIFLGNDSANDLVGMRGNDVLVGGAGDDWIDGGQGSDDAAVFSGTIWDYAISETDGLYTVVGLDGTDQVTGVEWFHFGEGEDLQIFSATEVLTPPPPPEDPQPTITGTAGNDRLVAGDDPDGYVIEGLAGNDLLIGKDGGDQLIGGSGVDKLYGKAGDDTITGGDGNDVLKGDAGADTLLGGDGFDRLYIDADDLLVDGGAGTDWAIAVGAGVTLDMAASSIERAKGDDGADIFDGSGLTSKTVLYGNGGDDVLIGGSGSDYIRGDAGADSLIGGAGNDRLYLDGDDVFVDGGAGVDWAFAKGGDGLTLDLAATNIEKAAGDGGNDTFDASGLDSQAFLYGKGGDDVLIGGGGRDIIKGDAGADTLIGGAGNDRLYVDGDDLLVDGGTGSDMLFVNDTGGVSIDLGAASIETATGDAGADVLDASTATERVVLYGKGGDDTLSGGDGDDLVRGDDGADVLIGGAGDDKLYVDADDTLVNGGDGIDWVYARGNSGLELDLAVSEVEYAVGGDFADHFDASGWADDSNLYGREGDDVLTGGGGDDLLRGDEGADLLMGGAGDDILFGGTGDDVFRFGLGDGADRIQDFNIGDLLEFVGISADSLSVDTLGDDVILSINGTTDSVRVDTPSRDHTGSYSITETDEGTVQFALEPIA
ncbi:S8 family serine peptidase [Magnetospira sp. QH-2]|uniref:S8 family serine peptidase n=1 Tax=Magnetospira sp. (strain QH-2) TaxID=1288970 RepID=UPI00130E20AD|nr:S8 family serine peptidase [Magnetospira sp. QH-2]